MRTDQFTDLRIGNKAWPRFAKQTPFLKAFANLPTKLSLKHVARWILMTKHQIAAFKSHDSAFRRVELQHAASVDSEEVVPFEGKIQWSARVDHKRPANTEKTRPHFPEQAPLFKSLPGLYTKLYLDCLSVGSLLRVNHVAAAFEQQRIAPDAVQHCDSFAPSNFAKPGSQMQFHAGRVLRKY